MDFFHASAVSRPMMNDTTRRQTIEVKSLQSGCLFIWATQMSILTGLPSKIKCSVGFLFIRNLSSSQRHITWNDKVIINDEAEGIKKSDVTFERVKQAGLVLCQGYFLRNRRLNQTQSSHFKRFISWGSRNWHHPIYCMTIQLVDV